MTTFTSIGPFRYHIPDSAPFYETRMSLLWLADALDLQRRPMGEKVVLKVARLKEEQFSLANQRAIDNEERWLRRLSHPGIIKLRPIAEDKVTRSSQAIFRARSTLPGQPWFVVTDYLPGGTLQSLVEERQKLGTALTLQLIHSLAVTLAYCHEQDCIHRDFKPQNVLFVQKPTGEQLRPESQPILIDFGIANQKGEQQLIAGTRPWLPPECDEALRAGEKLPAAPAMDIYALGLTLYFMLTGKRPPTFTIQVEQLAIGVDTLADIAGYRRAAIAKALHHLFRQTIATDPTERPSAQQVVAAIEQIQQLLPYRLLSAFQWRPRLVRTPPRWPKPAIPFAAFKKDRRIWAGGAVTALLFSLALLYGQARPTRPQPAPDLADSRVTPMPLAVANVSHINQTTPTPTVTPTDSPTTTTLAATVAVTSVPAIAQTVLVATVTLARTATPTQAPTSTPVPTSTATETATATAIPAAPSTPSPVREPAVAAALATNPTVILLEPLTEVLRGRQTFRWQTDVILAENQAFEMMMWPVGADPFTNGFGPFGITTATSITGDLSAFASTTGGRFLVRGRDYFWGVRLVERDPYRPLQYLGGAQQFRYEENTGPSQNDSPLALPQEPTPRG